MIACAGNGNGPSFPERVELSRSQPRAPLAALLLIISLIAPRALHAQTVLTPGPDAGVVPRGGVRLRVTTEWTRYDSFFNDLVTGTSTKALPLGSAMATDALGVAQIPSLHTTQSALRVLTGNSSEVVSLGTMTAVANSRIVVTPMTLEYGFTNLISFGVTVPIVQTRATLVTDLNGLRQGSNLAANTGGTITTDANVIRNAFANAASTIASSLAQCTTSPSQPVCARQQEAAALAVATQAYADAIGEIYGSPELPGQFVPLTGGDILTAAAARQNALNAQYRSFFGADISNGQLGGSLTPPGLNQLQAYLRNQGFGNRRDSLGTVERYSIGDIEVGAALRVQDNYRDTTDRNAGFRSRVAVRGALRLPTGLPAQTGLPFEIGTGGRFDIEGQFAADLRWTRFIAASLNARYALPIGERAIPFVPNPVNRFAVATPLGGKWKPGNVFAATVSPHVTLSNFFALNGYYSFVRNGSDTYTYDVVDSSSARVDVLLAALGPGYTTLATTQQRLGFGFSYSTIGQYARGKRPLPIEMRWIHQQVITGSSGIEPAASRDQIEVKIFYQR